MTRMHACPHCKLNAVPRMAVRYSSRESPAKCGACEKLCHVLASTSGGISGVCIMLLAAAFVAGMVLESYAVGLLVAALVVPYNIWAWRQVELFPISKESAKVAAQVSWWLLVLLAVFKIFSS